MKIKQNVSSTSFYFRQTSLSMQYYWQYLVNFGFFLKAVVISLKDIAGVFAYKKALLIENNKF